MSDDDVNPDSTWSGLAPEKRQRAIAIKGEMATLVAEFLDVIRTDEDEYVTAGDPPYLQAWVIGCEWTNMRLEQEDKGGRDVIAPEGQTLSNGAGLAAYILSRYQV